MSEKITSEKEFGFLIDASRCIDCRACLVACSVENEVPNTISRIWIKETGVTGQFPNLSRYSAPYHCMHCDDPSCVSACTVGALQRDANGIVTYDIDRCIGCRYCMYACPFEVPNFEWEAQLPLIVKCDMCVARLGEGEAEPACAATCPTDAIMFGEKSSMLAQAHQRIDLNPDKYVDHVYGETENGGTSTFYVSPVPFEEMGFPTGGSISPAYSNRLVTHGTPAVAGSVAIGLSGIYLTIKRHHAGPLVAGAEGEGETAVAPTPDETTEA
ncbi:MAG: 4Fe-4S dicluster domain-containing protein [Chloroflexi bacterium]|nr:4Fe-4S dicluster domain-containing protein [Chloroflexota bacterium]